MNIILRANSVNETHTKFTVFINKANCGELCMLEKDAVTFYFIVANGCYKSLDTFLGKGTWERKKDSSEGKT